MKISSKLVTALALLILIVGTLSAIKLISNREPEDIPSREATREEKIIEENQEKVPEEEPIEELLPIPELPEEEPKEPEIVLLSPQEQARVDLVDKYGEEVVSAWEKLSRDEFFDYIGYQLVVEERTGPEGEIYHHCYKILEDGTYKDAYVGGDYYVYGVFISTETIFELVNYHNTFFAIK